MGAPEHRNLQECRKKRLGDRSCKSGDPGLECLRLRLLGTIQKLMTPYTRDRLRLNVALSQLLLPASSLFPTITSSESSLLSWSPLRVLCRSACLWRSAFVSFLFKMSDLDADLYGGELLFLSLAWVMCG